MRQCTPKGMAPKADTILDRIAEFAKIICMPQILCPSNASTGAVRCPSDTDVLKISSLPKRSTSQILLCPLLVNVAHISTTQSHNWNEGANATRGHSFAQHSA